MRTILLLVGSLLPLFSAVVYIRSIYQGISIPQRMTRFLMLVITGVMTVSLWAEGDTSGVWLAFVSFMQALFVWALSFRYGMGGRNRLDFICLTMCFVGIGVWLWSGEALLGLLASIIADLAACMPSLHKTVRLPHTESLMYYALDTVAGVLIIAAGPYDWRAVLFPAYIAAINLAFVVIIYFGKRWAAPPPTPVG